MATAPRVPVTGGSDRRGQPVTKDVRVNVIAGLLPQAFCAGHLRPRVYISRRALKLLTEAELHAVLAQSIITAEPEIRCVSAYPRILMARERRSLGVRDDQPADSLLAALSDGDGPRPSGLRVDSRSVGAAQRGAGGSATTLARRCGR